MAGFHEKMRAGSTHDWRTGQHTNPVRAERRKAIASFGGIRRYKKAMRAMREQC